jgi:hypothetical protein
MLEVRMDITVAVRAVKMGTHPTVLMVEQEEEQVMSVLEVQLFLIE